MSKLKLKPCPFCGAKIEDKFPDVCHYEKNKWQVSHYCQIDSLTGLEVVISAYGTTKEQAVERWNGRLNRRRSDG